ncbi:hypothetical protein KTQ54_09495 [Komagataeibacter oboediens]|uniref:hypothetical protein n=1 Tax=Komagataeibacter oboediens TaxID=65958 RepID=UPI001C2C7878|nr:hypothetical protein [Komagataeibacter oboediens]MBV0888773.1 hypothetical protein [Komagataeibacter oboediens]MCK9821298.1 hypothetical protein [Komagataeibacter oboediens]
MGRRTDDERRVLTGRDTDQGIRGGFFVLRHALVEVARNASAFHTHHHASERPMVGADTWLRASLSDIASSCQRDYVLRGGTMEFESSGTLHILWVRIAVRAGGGHLIFGPKLPDSGLLLVDVTLEKDAPGAVSITFRDVASLSVTYDVETDITLIGLLSGASNELDCNAWAVVRFLGNVCGLPDECSEAIPGQHGGAPLHIRHYTAGETHEICIVVKK